MPSYEVLLLAGAFLALIAVWMMVVALINRTRVLRATGLMVLGLILLVLAERNGPHGASASEVLPAFFRLIGQAVNG